MIFFSPAALPGRSPWARLGTLRRAALAWLVAASVGCAPFETFELRPTAAHLRPGCQVQRGLWVAAQLVADPLVVEDHFGPDLRQTDFIPVIVYVENRGDTAFEIHRRDFQLILESGERFQPSSPGELRAELRRSTYPALVFAPLILPAVYFYQRIDEYNFHVAQTLHEKSLGASFRLEPGDPPITRAIYFRDQARSTRTRSSLESAVLEVAVAAEGTKAPPRDGGPPVRQGAPEQAGASSSPAAPPVVGETLSFTVAVSMEDT